MSHQILTNAKIVTRDEVIFGTVTADSGRIVSIDRGNTSLPGAQDLDGDYLIPGLIELHTDNMEKSFTPRPGVRWPALPAAIAHDVQVVGAGITTVFDALSVGDIMDGSTRLTQLKDMSQIIASAKKQKVLRADHYLHMRCELSFETVVDLFAPFSENPLVKLVSLMDHAPGQRQFADVEKYREYYQGKYHFSPERMDAFIEKHQRTSQAFSAKNRASIVELSQSHDLPLASHDDATAAHVDEAGENGVSISEFPTTIAAARAARDKGLHVLMGAPNMVRGQSHSGNISARELAAEGAMDILSSDYFPGSILQGIFTMHQELEGISLPQAVRVATLNPAAAAKMTDRGEISPGKRADLVRVRMAGKMPVVNEVWCAGNRVY
ncbi:alpha-D-ribose 1-methylphosphonate 5-triphosphate diphosphatase [Magnetovibrio blakemorei]|uniref:Phosphonate metabolism protein PhnM n=1 Tax=Magnetovibrio blakemorei TaxID=28181 RepID=A0A1E5Q4Y7_9PROT|nr:alpha-D-ribose 1-methylphosphonate 5-triphosphate diphosphatase [Magnetovibrio blakemorei]OEJ65072.1 phosphonate metabolism protein PhnM [Magnetovibrio blakemorei]